MFFTTHIVISYLVLVQLAVLVLLLAFLLECDDDKTDEYVDHEERDDDDVDEVVDGDFNAVVVYWALSLATRVDARVQQAETRRNTYALTLSPKYIIII